MIEYNYTRLCEYKNSLRYFEDIEVRATDTEVQDILKYMRSILEFKIQEQENAQELFECNNNL